MSGYCPDCGNTQCLCKEIEQQKNPTSSCMVDSVVGFSYVDITTKGCEGWLNLLWGDYPVALVDNVHIANQIREVVPLHKPNAEAQL